MDITITSTKLAGTVTPPASKSQAHRAVLALALSGGEGKLSNLSPSQDIQATQDCVTALKAAAPDGGLPLLDCGESGSTLRFLIPVALALRGGGHFTSRGRLMERPQGPYFQIFDEKGIFYQQSDGRLLVKGQLPPGEYRLRGDVSSQFVTGLLYALPLLDGDSEIVLTTPLESRNYVDMTLDVLQKFGVQVENRAYQRFLVPGNQKYRTPESDGVKGMVIEADWSQAAFWYSAVALGSSIDMEGLNPFSIQGDMAIAAHYLRLTQPGDVEIDVSQCPDLVPPLAAMAAVRQGSTYLTNAARLRMKESDRLSAVTEVLNALGADVKERPDSLTIHGKDSLTGGVTVDSHNDHRIAMMAAIAATRCVKPITVTGAECVAKSYPDFWKDYEKLGGNIQISE